MKGINKIMRQVALIGQFGLSLVVPLLMCLFLCWFLTDRFSIGGWIYIPGFIFGLGSSFMTAYKLYISECERSRKDKDHPAAFNRHL